MTESTNSLYPVQIVENREVNTKGEYHDRN